MTERRTSFGLSLLIGCCLLAALVIWTTPNSGDYCPGGQVVGDGNAAPAIEALAHGQLGAYLDHQPVMGLVSLLLRVPAALVARSFQGHPLLEYRLGALLCLCSLLPLAVWLTRIRQTDRFLKMIMALTVALLMGGPATVDAIQAGHPEEVLTAVLGVAAVIAAQREHEWWSGVLLGLAIGTKPWAVLAGVPVLLALPRGRWRCALATALTGSAGLVAAIADPSTFLNRSSGVGATHLVNPYSLWWPLSSNMPGAMLPSRLLPLGLDRSTGLGLTVGPASVAALAVALRNRTVARLAHPLALLGALWLIRAVADPHPNEYYYVPFLVVTAVWEIYAFGRLPVVSALGAGLLLATFALPFTQPAWPNTFLMVWTLALGAYLLRGAFGSRARGQALSIPAGVISTRRIARSILR